MTEQNSSDKGKVFLNFEPRDEFFDFVNNTNSIRWLENHRNYNQFAKNMIIHGDNLAAMAALRVSWLMRNSEQNEQFDLIYIDPPYNVGGNTGYRNKWKGESEGNFGWARDHGKFLDFMEPRLRMAKLLLKKEGVIFVSISDLEYPRLLLLMEEIFGEGNFIGSFIWDKKQGSQAESIKVLHEYIICFAKNKEKAPKFEQLKPGSKEMLKKVEELTKKFNYDRACEEFKKWINKQLKDGKISKGLAAHNLIHPISRRAFASNPTSAQDDNGSRYKEPLKHPITGKKCPVPKKGWKRKKDTVNDMLDYENVVEFGRGYICGRFLFGEDHTKMPRRVAYLDEMTKQKPDSIIRTKSAGHGDLPEGLSFPTPKPVDLIETIIKMIPSKNVRVPDFFAGSGTTAHAVENLNKMDKGNRSYVLIENMQETVNGTIVPRMNKVGGKKSFGLYSIIEKDAESIDLIDAFRSHAEEYIITLHGIERVENKSKEGINIVGFNKETNTIVATLMHEHRKANSTKYFRKELSFIANLINEYNASNVLICRIESEETHREEPWHGLNRDIFSDTGCRSFELISLPSAIIQAWRETLIALEAV